MKWDVAECHGIRRGAYGPDVTTMKIAAVDAVRSIPVAPGDPNRTASVASPTLAALWDRLRRDGCRGTQGL